MLDRQNAQSVVSPTPLSPAAVFAVQAVVTGLALALIASMVLPSPLWATTVFAAAVVVAWRGVYRTFPHSVLGLCNTVTLVRTALVALLFGTLMAKGSVSPWLVFWIGTLALSLDGVDGWLARRARLQSDFGARFDMETDAALGAVLALWLLVSGTTGAEVLVLGFMRYGFVLASLWLPQLRAPLPPSFRRKAICVVQIGALLALTCPLLPAGFVGAVSYAGAAALTYSFAVDILWLVRRPS